MGDIKGGDVLVFTMEILKIKGGKKPASRCNVKTLEKCSDKEKEYIQKQSAKGKEHIAGELKRLEGMRGRQMKEDKVSWLNMRIKLLGSMKDEFIAPMCTCLHGSHQIEASDWA